MSRRPLAQIAGVSVGSVLAALAALRRGKAVHPTGVVYDARFVVRGSPFAPRASLALSDPGEHRAVVRFSRSLGLPRPVPDLLGMSIRILDVYGRDRHQDFLLVTSVDLPLANHLFVPATDVQQRPYTSSLPYRAGDDLFLVGALPDPGSSRFLIAVAKPGRERFRPVAELAIGERLGPQLDALRFNPWNTGGGLAPAGWLNGARDRAYKLSQAAWGLRKSDGRQLQQAADDSLRELRG